MKPLRIVLNRLASLRRSLSSSIVLARSRVDAEGFVLIAGHVRLRATDGAIAHLAEDVVIDRFADITAKYGLLEIGARCYIGEYSVICARDAFLIGADCLIAEHV